MKLLNVAAAVLLGGAVAASAGEMMMSSGKSSKTTMAPEETGAWFVSAVGGPVWFQEISVGDTFTFDGDKYEVDLDVDFETGWGGTLAVGYKFANGFALSLSGGYYTATADTAEADIKQNGNLVGEVSADLEDLDIDLTIVPVNFNVIYGFPITDTIYSYVGAGAGATYSELDSDDIGEGDTWEFGAQGMAGFGFQVSENVGIKLGYRFLYTQVEEESLFGHALEAGVGVKF
jgi:opacity protein-like surface antigen